MPYIKGTDRERVLNEGGPRNAGELNFVITKLLDGYIAKEGLSYSVINEIVGVMECAKLELYRRVAAPYENVKISENGDVYENQKDGVPSGTLHSSSKKN